MTLGCVRQRAGSRLRWRSDAPPPSLRVGADPICEDTFVLPCPPYASTIQRQDWARSSRIVGVCAIADHRCSLGASISLSWAFLARLHLAESARRGEPLHGDLSSSRCFPTKRCECGCVAALAWPSHRCVSTLPAWSHGLRGSGPACCSIANDICRIVRVSSGGAAAQSGVAIVACDFLGSKWFGRWCVVVTTWEHWRGEL